jgi:hypothetical protein
MDDRKIKIAVCGESFCTASIIDLKDIGLRAHFSQMLEDNYGYDVLHLSHGAFSNTGIFFQIQEAVKRKVDVVVYNKTWSSRIEIVQNDDFFPDAGLKNFVYFDPHMPATGQDYVGNKRAPIISTVWQGLDTSPFLDISKEQLLAVELYLKHLFNYRMDQTVDDWVFEYWSDRMIKEGILPICFNDENVGKIAYDFSSKNINIDSPFHTDRATQEVIAANIDKLIKEKRG